MTAIKQYISEPDGEFNGVPVPEKPVAANDNAPGKTAIVATEWKFVDPAKIPPRSWLYGYHYIRKYVSTTISPGGLGKTSNSIAEALAMTTDRDLLGERVHERCKVWLFNEDPRDELDRRIAAACIHYGITAEDIGGRLFVDSFREQNFVAAVQMKNEVKIAIPFAEALEAEIRRKGVDVLIMDPFVSTHAVSENDNVMIDSVLKQFWQPILERTNCAAEFIHHSKKLGGAEVTAESARGAVALIGAARSARALNGMTKEEAAKAGVENHRQYFRVTDAKANMAPPSPKSTWRKLESVPLGNATASRPQDWVGVATEWKWPDTMSGVTLENLIAAQRAIDAGEWLESSRSTTKWAGIAVAEALGWDIDDPAVREKTKDCLRAWTESGALVVDRRKDKKSELRNYVVVGEWATGGD